MKDKQDPGTVDWADESPSALKNEKGELQLPIDPSRFLNCIIIHAKDMGRDPVNIIEDIHDATHYWLTDREIRKQVGEATALDYTRGLNS